MKVIKQGIKPENKVLTMECRYCKAVFEFEKREARLVYDQRDGNYLEIACPCCSEKLTHYA